MTASLRQMLPFHDAAELLARYQIGLPPFRLVGSPVEAEAAAVSLGFPVALKAISPDLSHKTEYGLVRLNLATREAVRQAAAEIMDAPVWQAREPEPGTRPTLEGLLVQQMTPPGVEMIVGVHLDPQFGPLVALGSGGVLVELLDDVVLRMPPVSSRDAMAMIQETRSWPLLQGFRHYPPADTASLTKLLVAVSRLAAGEEDHLAGMDLNPVIVLAQGHGLRVVDLRIETTVPW